MKTKVKISKKISKGIATAKTTVKKEWIYSKQNKGNYNWRNFWSHSMATSNW